MVYVDTSALVPYYCPEPLSQVVQQVIVKAEDVAISPLVEVEFASAIARKHRAAEMDVPTANRILATFRQHVADKCFRRFPAKNRHFELAADWLGRFVTALRTVDALHLALASDAGLTLLTADQVLAQAAGHFGVSFQLLSLGT